MNTTDTASSIRSSAANELQESTQEFDSTAPQFEFVMHPAPKLVIVEGNISAGKSTLCRALSDTLGYHLYLEPTLENPFLAKYYKEPKKYALPMQCWLLKQRFVTYVSALRAILSGDVSTPGVILDRSIFSDIVFAEKNFYDENFSREGYEFYLTLRKQMLSLLPAPHVVLYLDVPAEECYQRIHKLRKRDCEDGIPLAYLAGLDTCYGNFLKGMQTTGARVVSIPWSRFGDATPIAEHISGLAPVHIDEWTGDAARLLALLDNSIAMKMAMTPPYMIEEASGFDVDVADPEVVTTSEARDVLVVAEAKH